MTPQRSPTPTEAERMLPESEVVEMLDELARVNNELLATQRTLEQRTAELDRTVKKMNQLLGMANHDLRNPIGAVRGFSQTVRTMAHDRLQPQEDLLLERIETASDRMLRLVDEMLELSSVEHGVHLELDDVDLRRIVDEAADVVGQAAADKQITITLDGPGPVAAFADATKLDEVVSNLLTNAIKYTQRGGHVAVRLEVLEDDVQLQVTDDGVGIPPDEHELIFQPFSKASSRPTEGESSTGLGLAIAHQIVAAHGGQLHVTSMPGQGSTFTVALPRPSVAPPDSPSSQARQSRDPTGEPSGP